MNFFKRLIKTKTFWTGITSIASGAALCFAHDYAQGVPLIIAGLGMIFIRDSVAKLAAATAQKIPW
jgi:hypothetical protein